MISNENIQSYNSWNNELYLYQKNEQNRNFLQLSLNNKFNN